MIEDLSGASGLGYIWFGVSALHWQGTHQSQGSHQSKVFTARYSTVWRVIFFSLNFYFIFIFIF